MYELCIMVVIFVVLLTMYMLSIFSVEKLKETSTDISGQKSKDKKVGSVEELLKIKNRDFSYSKSKSSMFVMLTLGALFAILSSVYACFQVRVECLAVWMLTLMFFCLDFSYDGTIVAKLPFHPIALLQGFTHRNLPGTDMTDCSFVFIFALCSMAIRSNIQKYLGFAPKSDPLASMFAPPPEAK